MIWSLAATTPQLGFVFHAAAVSGVANIAAAAGTCERATNSARARGRSGAKSWRNFAGSREVNPSGVLRIAPSVLPSTLGICLPSADSFSPTSGAWAATYTSPTTFGCTPACVITEPP